MYVLYIGRHEWEGRREVEGASSSRVGRGLTLDPGRPSRPDDLYMQMSR